MAHADMAEGVEHTLVGKNAIGERELRDQVGQILGYDSPWCGVSGNCRYINYAIKSRTLKARRWGDESLSGRHR